MSEKKTNREHSFDKELAAIVGIEKAILIKNISYWCEENERRKIDFYKIGDLWWTSESLTSLSIKYPYMKRGNLSRWLNTLNETGWIRMHKGEKGNNFYAPGAVFEAWNTGEDWEKVFQNETEGCFKMKQEVFQNETASASNSGNKCDEVFQNEMAINNIDKSIKSNSENNVDKNAPKKALSITTHAPQPPINDFGITTVEHAVIDLEENPKPKPAARPKKQTAVWKVDPETEIQELLTDELCKERMFRQCRVPLDLFETYVRRFELKVGSEQAEHNNRRDFRSHFFNWAAMEYIREQKGDRPTATTPDGLLKEISEWYHKNPALWHEAKQYGKVEKWTAEKLKGLVTEFCAWQIKNGNGNDTFAQHNAGIQSWFLRETKATVAGPSVNVGGRQHFSEPKFKEA